MKDKILKIAKVKDIDEFYCKFPTEESFMAKYGKEFKKAAMGTSMVNKQLKQLTDFSNIPKAWGGTEETISYKDMVQSPTPPTMKTIGEKLSNPAFQQQAAKQASSYAPDNTLKNIGALAGNIGRVAGNNFITGGGLDTIVGGVGAIKEQKSNIKKARQQGAVTDVVAKAAESRDVNQPKRQYVRPEDIIIQPDQFGGAGQGTGTNYLAEDGMQIGGNLTEIQNTYAPNSIYTDLGYEPLEDSNIKQYKQGGNIPRADFGDYFQDSGQAQIGSAVGSAIGNAILPGVGGRVGGFLGKIGGNLFGGAQDAQRLREAQNKVKANTEKIALQQQMQGLQSQNSAYMENGGEIGDEYKWMSHNWQPQVIAKFGDIDVSDIHSIATKDMDTLRSGGHIRENYMFDTDYMPIAQDGTALNGEVRPMWGGDIKDISYNPYTGPISMGFGNDHNEYDGQGRSGIGMKFGNGGHGEGEVEIQTKEPILKTPGEPDSVTVLGGRKINSLASQFTGAPKGITFQKAGADIAKSDNKINAKMGKVTNKINSLDIDTPLDNLEMSSYMAMKTGLDMRQKKNAETLDRLSHYQNSSADIASALGMEINAFDKGEYKPIKNSDKAAFGSKLEIAQDGTKEFLIKGRQPGSIDYNSIPVSGSELWNTKNYKSMWIPKVKEAFSNPTKAKELINRLENYSGQDAADVREALKKGKTFEDKKNIAIRLATDEKVGPYHKVINDLIDQKRKPEETIPTERIKPTYGGFEPKGAPMDFQKTTPEKTKDNRKKTDWENIGYNVLGQVAPFLRPTNQMPLDPTQLMGEYYSLATNQLEPVQAQKYTPMLDQVYDISLQDQLNAIDAQSRAAMLQTGNDPSAQSAILAQVADAKSKVLGEQTRLNQALKSSIYSKNRDIINDAALKNLAILDQQYERQAKAKSATKAQAAEAIKSIADKELKNRLENRTLGVYENMYNYRFTPKGVAYNVNTPYQFNMEGDPFARTSMPSLEPEEGKEFEYNSKGKVTGIKSKTKEKERNGGIVKAIKNL